MGTPLHATIGHRGCVHVAGRITSTVADLPAASLSTVADLPAATFGGCHAEGRSLTWPRPLATGPPGHLGRNAWKQGILSGSEVARPLSGVPGKGARSVELSVGARVRDQQYVTKRSAGGGGRVGGRRADLAFAPVSEDQRLRTSAPSRSRSARSSRGRWCPVRSGGRPARPCRSGRAGSRRRCGRGSRRTRLGAVEPRWAQPFDRAVGGDERGGATVRQEREVGDRRERRAARDAVVERRRGRRARPIPRVHRAGAAQPRLRLAPRAGRGRAGRARGSRLARAAATP